MAAGAEAQRCRNGRAVAVRLFATPRWRDGAGIATRRCVVQNLRSEDRCRPCCVVHAATTQKIPAARQLSGDRTTRVTGGLSDPVQGRRCRRRRAKSDRGRRQPRSLGFSRSLVPHPQHRRPTGQPAGRTLSLCRAYTAAPGGAPALAWKKNRSAQAPAEPSQTISPIANLLRERHSTRSFDDRQPITLAELSQFLDSTARVQSKWKSRIDIGGGGPVVAYAARPYPSGGSAYELELYLAVAGNRIEDFQYSLDADRHALVPISGSTPELDAQLAAAELAVDRRDPQILITIAARFDRISWKYSSIAYALILKDVGVLIRTLYLMATDMGLGGRAIGSIDIDLFAKMTANRIPRRRPGRSICARSRLARPGAK